MKMTRKCIICKEKNYKNACSFFSAPKDSGTRHLWQQAINIKGYTVNDDTYVCSKHFNKDDIITHWVSGVPPQVITIKYKKCRLRRGAVPIPINNTINIHSEKLLNTQDNGIMLDGKKYFIKSRKKEFDLNDKLQKTRHYLKESLNCNLEDEIYEYIPEDFHELEELKNTKALTETSKRQKLIKSCNSDKEQRIYSTNKNKEILYINYTNINDNGQNIVTYFPKKTYCKINNTELNKTSQRIISKKNEEIISSSINWPIGPKLEMNRINKVEQLDEYNKTNFAYASNSIKKIIYCDRILMLFEDFLELYHEVSLPTSWFASMVTKGHDITIVYSCMNISNTGMPYVEKKVFLNNDMILRCGIFNKEIKKINFLKNGKNLYVYTLSDIEDFIEEFNKTSICTGIIDKDYINKINSTMIVLDGEIRRHNECSMVLSKGQTQCLQCASLINHKIAQKA